MFHPDSPLMKVLTWLSQLVEIQFWWVIGVLRGFIIAGIFPATFAMFATSRSLIRGGETFSIRKKFFESYKQDFKNANLVGYFWLAIEILVVVNFRSSLLLSGTIGTAFFWISYAVVVLWSLVGIYTIPVYSQFDIPLKELFRHVIVVMLSSPIHTLAMFIIFFIISWLIKKSLILLFLIVFAAVCDLIMRIANHRFKKIEKKITR